MQIAQFAKAVFNLSAICKMKKCLFRSTRWRIVPLSICVICANCAICKSCFQFECNLQNEEMYFQIYSLEDRTLINLCNLCKLHNLQKLFSIWVHNLQNLQNEEMSFQIYTLEDRTVINLCNLCKLHNLQKLFSIWVQSAKWRNVFSDLLVGGSYPYQFV